MPDTGAERQRRFKLRRAGLLPLPERLCCSDCLGGRSGLYGDRCRRCWERSTPEGRAAKAKRVSGSRARRKRDNLSTGPDGLLPG
jgi:hypothetical protein